MSSNNSQSTGGFEVTENPDEQFLMAGNTEDLGMDGLAGSIWATPGVTYGTKKEILIEEADIEAEKKKRLAEAALEEKKKKDVAAAQMENSVGKDAGNPAPGCNLEVDIGKRSNA
ncbi:hypothetical protein VTL71DRAFT_3728 [Oculimacula yallundae]|uniref:Uncharacterized protein n=1 Tax=Oculimacula yallundae TaxID=86028 RepID=A0ABR4C5H7_9HELO